MRQIVRVSSASSPRLPQRRKTILRGRRRFCSVDMTLRMMPLDKHGRGIVGSSPLGAPGERVRVSQAATRWPPPASSLLAAGAQWAGGRPSNCGRCAVRCQTATSNQVLGRRRAKGVADASTVCGSRAMCRQVPHLSAAGGARLHEKTRTNALACRAAGENAHGASRHSSKMANGHIDGNRAPDQQTP